MSIATPEIASLCGALDSDALVDGQPMGAHVLRPLIRTTNRMLAKAQPLFNLLWPEVTYGAGDYPATYLVQGIAPSTWIRLGPPIPIAYRPGLHLMTAWLRARINSGNTLEVYLATSRRPWRPSVPADAAVAGTGSFANSSISGIEISEGGADRVELWIRGGSSSSALANESTYGSPNEFTGSGGTMTVTNIGNGRTLVYLSSAAWNPDTGSNPTLAGGGHVLQFQDAAGDPALPSKVIASVPDSNNLILDPGLLTIRDHALANTLQRFQIFQSLPQYALTNFGAYAQARSA